MRYVGGKSRIAGWVEENLRPFVSECSEYIEPFVGGAAVLERMADYDFERIYAGDAHEDLILMWRAARAGWVPPEHVSRDEYDRLRGAPPSRLRGFVGYGASFSGKWFGGYVDSAWDKHHNRYTKPYAAAASRSVVKAAAKFGRVVFRCQSFDRWEPSSDALVYCDPPYANTLGYDAVGSFDHDHFWRVVSEWSENGARVVVSEAEAPEGWVILDERERRAMLRATKGGQQAARAERLFVYSGGAT